MPVSPTLVHIDEARHLLYRSSHMMMFEEQVGKGWIQAVTERTERQLVYFLWAGMRYREERLTPQEVGERLDKARDKGVSIGDLWDGVARALQNSGFLPQAVQNGVPTTTAASSPGPSPGESAA